MAYKRLKEFSSLAEDTPELWRIGAVLGLMLLVVLGLQQLMFTFIATLSGPETVDEILKSSSETAGETLTLLFSHGFYTLGLAAAVWIIHQRGFLSLFGPGAHAVGDFFRVLYWLVPLYLAIVLLAPTDYELLRNEAMPRVRWLMYLPLALAAIALQVGTEEAFFRGYLIQQLRAGTRAESWAWMAVPAGLFALLHYTTSSGSNAVWFVLWALCFGLAAADLTARAGNLGPALALHIVNNAVALLGVSLPGTGSGLALYYTPFDESAAIIPQLMPLEFALLGLAWLAARIAIRA